MKPIKLSLTKQHINSLAYSFRFFKQLPENERAVKCLQSILIEVKIKVEKKEVVLRNETNLFNKDKRHTISLKYYEADCLEKYLMIAETYPLSDYDRNVVLMIKSKINQQLA